MSSTVVRSGDARRTLAPFGRRPAAVVDNAAVGAYRVITVLDELGGQAPPRPGQFYMLAAQRQWGGGAGERPFLGRAFSVLRARPGAAAGTLELDFLLADVGPGTARLCDAAAGERLWLTGPLGRGFEAPAGGAAAVLIGGGVGIAPLAIWQDELAARSTDVVALLGFRDAHHAVAAALLSDAAVATDDGSVGHHGLVTELLDRTLTRGAMTAATVYACGPAAMLEAVRARCEATGTTAQLALEAPMACGYGGCYGCVVATRDGYKRVCLDGPVFDATELAGDGGEIHGR